MNVLWSARSNFSLGECIFGVGELIATAKERNYTHIALADTMSVSGIIDASKAAKKAGVELITGVTLIVTSDDLNFRPKVYACDEAAFKVILKTLSQSDVGKFGVRSITRDAFIAMLNAGSFVVTSGDAFGVFASGNATAAIDDLVREIVAAVTPANFAAELVASARPYYAGQNARVLAYADLHALPLIVSSAARYANREDSDALDLMNALSKGQKADSKWRDIMTDTNFSLPTPNDQRVRLLESLKLIAKLSPTTRTAEIKKASHILRGVDDSNSLVTLCAYRWQKAEISLPVMAEDEFKALMLQCVSKWKSRLEVPILGFQPSAADMPKYKARLSFELGVIRTMGFSNYFLLVADLVDWSKKNGILVGPGRGSVGGSLASFILGITDVDPIRFNLLFERFINPDRIDLPDADLDFSSERRHEAINYLIDKYGAERVASISNYITLGSPSALRAVGAFFGLPERDYACSKQIPKEHGINKTLEESLSSVAELTAFKAKYPKEFALAQRLEGQFRTFGTHAAGVVVAAVPIHERAVVELRGEVSVVNWDKRVVEDQGLVKMDILGLNNLDVLKRCIDKIEWSYGRKINLLDIELEELKVMEAFGRGETMGVFQFESPGMRRLLKDLRVGGVLTFEDLSAATALYRPGPLDAGLLSDYVAVRQGVASVYYDHANMESALRDTFGVIVYQEQVMQVARDLAGFTMTDADHLRKAMGKKDKDMMAKMREQWVNGCASHSGVEDTLSNALFDKIEVFAGYAFNRSHSVEYSVISVWCMWMKVHYPHEYVAACLEVFGEDKLQGIVMDAAKKGIEILPPDINESHIGFRRFGDHLMAPFSRVKGLSEVTATAIIAARDECGGKFSSYEEFDRVATGRRCNIRHKDVLKRVGAFANLIEGELPARHPDRVKDQLELMPGLITATVKVDRSIPTDAAAREMVGQIMTECRETIGGIQPLPRLGKKAKIMVVVDCPSKIEEERGRLMEGDNADYVKQAIKAAGLSLNDIYYTALVKSPKRGKMIATEEINAFAPFFEQELAALKPPVVICLGGASSRYICPDEKGGVADLSGRQFFQKARDCTVILGISPGMIYFDPSKQEMLNEVFQKAAELLV